MCGAVLLAMAVFGFLVWDTLDGANDMIAEVEANRVDGDHTSTRINMPFHSIVIRIVSSYLQIAGMLLQFDLQYDLVAVSYTHLTLPTIYSV